MSPHLERLKTEVMELTESERAALAHHLISSLDDDEDEDPAEVERAWEEEIQHRLDEYRAGRMKASPVSEVLARLRDRYK